MTDVQREHYDGADEIGSDPFHLLDRDNRNHAKKQRIILDRVQADAGDRVLEVGCGDGLHAPGYAQRYEYAGIDLSQSLVEQTRERVDAVADRWTVRQADALDLEWRDDEFGAVVGTAILHHLPDYQRALAEWVRVTESGGSVTLMEPNALFPKDLLTAYAVEAERHKRQMFPWRLKDTLAAVDGADWTVDPRIYTPPWPERAAGVFDRVDELVRRLPGARWASQMLLIHGEVR